MGEEAGNTVMRGRSIALEAVQHAGTSAISLAPAVSGCGLPDVLFCSHWSLEEPSVAFAAFSAGDLFAGGQRCVLSCSAACPAGGASWPGCGLAERCGVCWLRHSLHQLLSHWALNVYGELRSRGL